MTGRSDDITIIKDNNDFRVIYKIFYSALISFSNKYVSNDEISKDIIQNVFISLWEKHYTFNNFDSIKCFLYTSVRNRCLNYLQHQKIEQKYINNIKLIQEKQFYKDYIIEEETNRQIYRQLENLAPKTRRIILYHIMGYSNSQISEKTGLSINTVKTLKSRAYRNLKKLLFNLEKHFS